MVVVPLSELQAERVIVIRARMLVRVFISMRSLVNELYYLNMHEREYLANSDLFKS